MKNHIGNLISWSSVVIVCLSLYTRNPSIVLGGICLAAIMDMFDGKMARKYGDGTRRTCIFGELTDSLCDIFNFGIAPSIALSFLLFATDYSIFLLLTSTFFILAGNYRLARFSAEKDGPIISYYEGIPITIAGPLLALTSVVFHSSMITILATITFALLMVSRIKIKKIKV